MSSSKQQQQYAFTHQDRRLISLSLAGVFLLFELITVILTFVNKNKIKDLEKKYESNMAILQKDLSVLSVANDIKIKITDEMIRDSTEYKDRQATYQALVIVDIVFGVCVLIGVFSSYYYHHQINKQ